MKLRKYPRELGIVRDWRTSTKKLKQSLQYGQFRLRVREGLAMEGKITIGARQHCRQSDAERIARAEFRHAVRHPRALRTSDYAKVPHPYAIAIAGLDGTPGMSIRESAETR